MTDQSDLRGLQDYHANPTAHTAVIVHVAPRWIAVSEGLPEIDTAPLVGKPSWAAVSSEIVNIVAVDDDGNEYVSTGHRYCFAAGCRWYDNVKRRDVVVTHWQPLPDLPEGNR